MKVRKIPESELEPELHPPVPNIVINFLPPMLEGTVMVMNGTKVGLA